MKLEVTIPDQAIPALRRMNELLDGEGLRVPCEYMELRNQVLGDIVPAILNAMEDQE